jgi:hypothetical protein
MAQSPLTQRRRLPARLTLDRQCPLLQPADARFTSANRGYCSSMTGKQSLTPEPAVIKPEDDDLRLHDHDFERPEADALEQEIPVCGTPTSFSSDADRIEPLDDADSASDEFRG